MSSLGMKAVAHSYAGEGEYGRKAEASLLPAVTALQVDVAALQVDVTALQAQAMESIANAAALTTLVPGNPGQLLYMKSRKALLVYVDDDTHTVDNVQVFAPAAPAPGHWLRLPDNFSAWGNVATLAVNNTTGNDDNPGTALLPLLTLAELGARLNDCVIVGVSSLMTISIVGTYTTDSFVFRPIVGDGVTVKVVGNYTQTATGTVSASNVPVAATSTPARYTDPAVPAVVIGTLVRSPPTTGNVTWIDKDLGGGQVRTATVMAPVLSATGTMGVTYELASLTTMRIGEMNIRSVLATSPAASQAVQFNGFEFASGGANDQDANISCETRLSFFECKFQKTIAPRGSFSSSSQNAVLFSNCYFAAGALVTGTTGTTAVQGSIFHAGALTIGAGGSAIFQVAQGLCSGGIPTGIVVADGGSLRLNGVGCGLFDCTGASVLIQPNATIKTATNNNEILWGNTNVGVGVQLLGGPAHLDYPTAQTHVVTGTAGDFFAGNVTTNLTTINTTVSPTTTNTAAQTWANLIAAIGAPGFGGSILNPTNGASIYRVGT